MTAQLKWYLSLSQSLPGLMDLSHIQIETERLLLRPTAPEDFEGWAAFMADEESTRHLGGVQSRAVAWRGFLAMAGCVGDPGLRDVLGDRESERTLGRSARAVEAGRLAGYRSRLGSRS